MGLYYLFVSLCIGPDVGRLGADDFDTRENATGRLAVLGWLARPELLKLAAATGDPEVRHRVERLTRRQDGAVRRFQRAAVLAVDWWPGDGFWDEGAREAVWEESQRRGVPSQWVGTGEYDVGAPWRLRPSTDRLTADPAVGWPVPFPSVHERCNQAAANVRRQSGVYPAAPLPKVKP